MKRTFDSIKLRIVDDDPVVALAVHPDPTTRDVSAAVLTIREQRQILRRYKVGEKAEAAVYYTPIIYALDEGPIEATGAWEKGERTTSWGEAVAWFRGYAAASGWQVSMLPEDEVSQLRQTCAEARDRYYREQREEMERIYGPPD